MTSRPRCTDDSGVDAAEPGGGLLASVGVYGLSTALGQAVAVLSVPLYARWLGPREYGHLEVLTVVASLLISACGDSMASAILALWHTRARNADRTRLLGTGVKVGGAAALVAAGAALLVCGSAGIALSQAFVVALAGAVLTVVSRLTAERFRAEQRPWSYLLAAVLRSAAGAGVGVALVATVSPTATGALAGVVVGSLIGLVFATLHDRRGAPVGWGRADARALVRLGWPLVPAGLAGWSLMLVDRFVIVAHSSLEAVGVYALANRAAGVLFLVAYGFGAAWVPFSLELIARGQRAERDVRALALWAVTAVTTIGGVWLAALAPSVLPAIAGPEYEEAGALVAPLAFGFALLPAASVAQPPLLAAGRTIELAWCVGCAALTNLGAALVLVPRYGLAGAAVATVTGFGVQAILCLWRAQAAEPAPRLGRSSAALCLVAVSGFTAVAIGQQINSAAWTASAVVGVPLLLLVVLPGRVVGVGSRSWRHALNL